MFLLGLGLEPGWQILFLVVQYTHVGRAQFLTQWWFCDNYLVDSVIFRNREYS